MAFVGVIDTLNLLFDRLQYIFSGYNPICRTFLEMNNLYKQGNISDRKFFETLNERMIPFSALEFLLIKAIFEIKKVMDKTKGITSPNILQVLGTNPSQPNHLLAGFIAAKNLPGHERLAYVDDKMWGIVEPR